MSYVGRMTTQTVGGVPEFRLCDRLRRAREITGLDQAAFAAELGISRTSVSNAETGTRRLAAAVLAALALVLLGAAAAAGVEPYDDARPAGPSSAREYAAMWASLPADQWGAGDVSLSVPLGDGRVVWLYGDTMSTGRFVHSSAIVQTRWSLHVSHRGRQILPNEPPAGGRRIWYWIEAARLVQPDLLEVTVGQISGGAAGVWDFHRTRAASRVALVAVDPAGDLDFVRWLRWTPQPHVDNRMTVLGPHHYTYLDKAHPEAELASGRVLWTASQNWDDPAGPQLRPDGSIDFTAYRPIWTERAPH